MRRPKVEDMGIKDMLNDEYNRCCALIVQIEQALKSYPSGSLVIKKVKSNNRVYEYHHLQWREGAKVLSRHIPAIEVAELNEKIRQREAYLDNLAKLQDRVNYLAKIIGKELIKRIYRRRTT